MHKENNPGQSIVGFPRILQLSSSPRIFNCRLAISVRLDDWIVKKAFAEYLSDLCNSDTIYCSVANSSRISFFEPQKWSLFGKANQL
jgi:hypothetical protein